MFSISPTRRATAINASGEQSWRGRAGRSGTSEWSNSVLVGRRKTGATGGLGAGGTAGFWQAAATTMTASRAQVGAIGFGVRRECRLVT
jgi:hypothetical protein